MAYIPGTAEADLLVGTTAFDVIAGFDGNDILNDGGFGASDELVGGLGDDIYVIANAGATLVEYAGEGNDFVSTFLTSFRLSAHIENLTFNSTLASVGIGNDQANEISGTFASDLLIGGAGDDRLHGGPARIINSTDVANTLIGGTGNDIYFVYTIGDTIIELADEGNDWVVSDVPFHVLQPNVENLTYSPWSQIHGNFVGIGNDLGNAINGKTGRDTLSGGGGDDLLTGFTGAANELIGGTGNDRFVVGAIGDSVIEYAGEGTDEVQTDLLNFILPANVENLLFTGSALGRYGVGNEQDNVISGSTGSDTLSGEGGNDTLRSESSTGQLGLADTLIGGTGNDRYIVNSNAHTIIETIGSMETGPGGTDIVESWTNSFTLPDQVENLVFVGGGTAPRIGTGNAQANDISGSLGDDSLSGLDGHDTLNGFEGNDAITGGNGDDVLIGNAGDDVYYYLGGETGSDTILAFTFGFDRIAISRAGFGARATVDFVTAANPVASGTNSAILYSTTTGLVSFDADGTGAAAAIALATITDVPQSLSAANFIVF